MSQIKRDHSRATTSVGQTYGERRTRELLTPTRTTIQRSTPQQGDTQQRGNVSDFKANDRYRGVSNIKSKVPYRGARLHHQQEGSISNARTSATRPTDKQLDALLGKIIQNENLHNQRSAKRFAAKAAATKSTVKKA